MGKGMRPPRPGSVTDFAVRGTLGAASGGVITGIGTVLSEVGLVEAGALATTTGTSMATTATMTVMEIPLIGGYAATAVGAVSAAATVAVPIAAVAAVGYGLFRLCKWAYSD